MASEKPSIFERFTPILLIASILLAFAVGVLWQKVQNLEKGSGVANLGQGNTAPSQPTSVLADLPALAKSIGVDVDKFQECAASDKFSKRIESDYQEGINAGVTGTPAIFVKNDKNEGWLIAGALPLEEVKKVLDVALGKGGTTPTTVVKLTPDQLKKLPALKDNDHITNGGKKVTLIEYSDFQCPYCQRFHPTLKAVMNEYKDSVSVVYRHFPLDQIHPYARPAAVASECVTELKGEDAFWEFADKAFTS